MKSLHLAMAGGRCRRQGNTGRQVAGAGTGRQGNMQGVPETHWFHGNSSSALESTAQGGGRRDRGEGEGEGESASESAPGAYPNHWWASYCSHRCGHP